MSAWLSNRRLRTKLLMLLALMTVVAGGIGAVAVRGMATMQSRSDYMYGHAVQPLLSLAQMRASALRMRTDVLNAAISPPGEAAEAFAGKIPDWDATFDKALAAFTAAAELPEGDETLARLEAGMTAYRQV